MEKYPGQALSCHARGLQHGLELPSELLQQLLHFIFLSVLSCSWQGEIPRVMDMKSPAARLSGILYLAFPALSSWMEQDVHTNLLSCLKSSLCLALLLEATSGLCAGPLCRPLSPRQFPINIPAFRGWISWCIHRLMRIINVKLIFSHTCKSFRG